MLIVCLAFLLLMNITQALCLGFFNYKIKLMMPPQFGIIPEVLHVVIFLAESSGPRPVVVT